MCQSQVKTCISSTICNGAFLVPGDSWLFTLLILVGLFVNIGGLFVNIGGLFVNIGGLFVNIGGLFVNIGRIVC